jgi:hypothetical protein
MLKLKHGKKEKNFYSIAEAAQIVTHERRGIPVQGIHSETLRRTYRDSGRKHGTNIGRDVFFTIGNLESMGYKATGTEFHDDTHHLVITLNLED